MTVAESSPLTRESLLTAVSADVPSSGCNHSSTAVLSTSGP